MDDDGTGVKQKQTVLCKQTTYRNIGINTLDFKMYYQSPSIDYA